jgi:hypothetical protein
MFGRSSICWESPHVSAVKRPSREHEKRAEPPEGAILLEEYCEREGITRLPSRPSNFKGFRRPAIAPPSKIVLEKWKLG